MNEVYDILVTFHCKDGQRETFLRQLVETGTLDASRGEEACLRYDIYLSVQDANEFMLVERWASKELQQVHCTLPHMQTMRQLEKLYIESVEQVEITVH